MICYGSDPIERPIYDDVRGLPAAMTATLQNQTSKEKFPVLVPQNYYDGWIEDLNGGFIDYIERLLEEGFQFEDLPDFFRELFDLSAYLAQVHNFGHAQFIDNSGTATQSRLRSAAAGAKRLGASTLQDVLSDLAVWFDAHSDAVTAADVMNRFPKNAELERLDGRIYSANFDQPVLDAFLASQPTSFRDWVKGKQAAPGHDLCDEHAVRVALFLLGYEHTQIVSDDKFSEMISDLAAHFPKAQIQRAEKRLMAARRSLPPAPQLAFSLCIGKIRPTETYRLSETWEILAPQDEFSVTATSRSDKVGFVLERQGASFSLCKRQLSWRARIAGNLRQILAKPSKSPRAQVSNPTKFVKGKLISRVMLDIDPQEFFAQLHVAEALSVYDHREYPGLSFAYGYATNFSVSPPQITWRYEGFGKDASARSLELTATSEQVTILDIAAGKQTTSSASTLKSAFRRAQT